MFRGRTHSSVPSGLAQTLFPSIGDIIFISLLSVLTLHAGQGLLGDGDTGYHVRTGEIILQTFDLPSHDPYSYHQPPLHWIAHEWLAEVIMALLFRAGNFTALVIFFVLLLTVTHWLLFLSLRSRSRDIFLCILVSLLATASSAVHWLARPHVFSLFFTVIWCHQLYRFQEGDDAAPWYLPLLMLLWVNLHGGFIIGIILTGVYLGGNVFYLLTCGRAANAFGRKAKILTLVLLGTILASIFNPVGIEILWFPIRVATDRFLADHVIEFLSPNFHEPIAFKYMFLAVVAALAFSRKLTLIETMLVVLFSYMALYSARHISLFAIVVAPLLLKCLQDIVRRLPDSRLCAYRRRIANLAIVDSGLKGYIWPVGSLFVIITLAAFGTLNYQFSEKKFPVAAVEFLQRHPISGNMFNSDEFGDYLIFAAWPSYRVFMDGRSDVYGEKYGRDYLRAARGLPGWESVLEKYDISWVFFDTKSPLAALLQENPNWHPIYSDTVATIFVKSASFHRSTVRP